jgi:hypothetical protein
MSDETTAESSTATTNQGRMASPATSLGGDIASEMAAYARTLEEARTETPTPKVSRVAPAKRVKEAVLPPEDSATPEPESEQADLAAQNTEKSSDAVDDTSTDEKPGEKPVPFDTFKKRIDKITAQRHAAEQKLSAAELENKKLYKAIEIMKSENERYASQLKLDPTQEKIRSYEIKEQVEAFVRELNQSQAQAQAEAKQQEYVQTRAQEIISTAKTLAAQYGVDARHIMEIQQVSSEPAEEIARRLSVAFGTAPKATPKPAPKTVAKGGLPGAAPNYGRNGPVKTEDMMDFLKTLG